MARNLTGEAYAATKYISLPVRKDAQLMDFLMEQMSGTSRNRAKDLLAGRAVMVDRKIVTRYDYELKQGMMVQITRHKRNSDINSPYLKIVYEDKDIIVIEKAPGILSMGSSPTAFCVKTVLDAYFRKRNFKCTTHIVHRLDRETSGLMMYAKNIDAQRILEAQWKELVYDRRYIAVLAGEVKNEGGTIRSWLHETKSFLTVSSSTNDGGKEAITHYHTLKTNNKYSLVELKLETGRKNQIRVHAKDMGHPVVGDKKYGNGTDPIGRLALHAYRLNFYHPFTHEQMIFETPFPTRFTQLVDNNMSPTVREE